MHDDQQPTTSYESVKDTARRLGISENAVRLRIKRGTIVAEKIGDNWFVVVGDDQQPVRRPTTSDQSVADTLAVVGRDQLATYRDEWLLPLVDRLGELERDNGRLTAELDHERRRAEMAELEQAGERQLREVLESRLSELEAQTKESPSVAENTPQSERERPQRPWWKVWERQ